MGVFRFLSPFKFGWEERHMNSHHFVLGARHYKTYAKMISVGYRCRGKQPCMQELGHGGSCARVEHIICRTGSGVGCRLREVPGFIETVISY